MTLVLVLVGCAHRSTGTIEVVDADVEPAATGLLSPTDGLVVDASAGWRLEVPEAWSAERGDDTLRFRGQHVQTGARVEIWAFSGRAFEPVPRSDCRWNYHSRAPYRRFGFSGSSVTAATCTPHDPGDAYVFAWIVPRSDSTLHLEVVAPAENLTKARRAGEDLLRRVAIDGG